jgi:hypothetical protein
VIVEFNREKLAFLGERQGDMPIITIDRWLLIFACKTSQREKCFCSSEFQRDHHAQLFHVDMLRIGEQMEKLQ